MAIRGDEVSKITIDFSDGRYLELDKTNVVSFTISGHLSGGGIIEMELSFDGITWAMRESLPMPQQVLQSGKEVIYLTGGE